MEDFVSFEIAKKLKEKGFNFGCIKYYDTNHELKWSNSPWLELDYNNSIGNKISAPTISQVLKWLREEKKLYVEISCNYTDYFTTIRKIDDHTTDYVSGCDIYNTYEEAAIAGIEYVLDNLI